MPRKGKKKPKPRPVLVRFCPMCGANRQGPALLAHCVDKHQGRLPLLLTYEDACYVDALKAMTGGQP
jgi:hypothetical protein